ncbi:MAG TPA: hypothetical protein VMR59_00600 [Patescibacteria group bacterium]|nr:hypothetical protein [Patescibacteria group bacterium]
MRTGLESLRLSPDPSPSVPKNEPTAKILIESRQLMLNIVASSPAGSLSGMIATEFIVVNSRNARIISIEGDDDTRRTLYSALLGFTKEHGLNILLSDKVDEKTKQWLVDNNLPDYSNPNI